MHKELCGSIFRGAVEAAMATGIEGFTTDDRIEVVKSFEDLRLDRALAREVVAEVGRK